MVAITEPDRAHGHISCVCERDGQRYELDLLALAFPTSLELTRLQTVYSQWLHGPTDLPSGPGEGAARSTPLYAPSPVELGYQGSARRHRPPPDPVFHGDAAELLALADADRRLELVITSCKATRLRCRVLARIELEVVLHSRHHDHAPTDIVLVRIDRARMRHHTLMVTGQIEDARRDISRVLSALRHDRARNLTATQLAYAMLAAYESHARSLQVSSQKRRRHHAKLSEYPLFDILAQDLGCLAAYAYLGEFALDHGELSRAARYFRIGLQLGRSQSPVSTALERCVRGLAHCEAAGGWD